MGSRSDTVPSNVSSRLARSDPDPTGRRLAYLSLASADLSKRTRQKARPDPGQGHSSGNTMSTNVWEPGVRLSSGPEQMCSQIGRL